jgi:hypothetical protein
LTRNNISHFTQTYTHF